MKTDKLITIVTTLYNKEKYLKTWAESLAKQTFLDNMQILVIEDCSTDGSLKLLKKLVKKYNLPVKILRNEKNRGLLYNIRKAYNALLTPEFSTKYFAVLDADDYYIASDKVEKAINFLESHSDFSAYVCNYILSYSNAEDKVALPKTLPNTIFTKMNGTPFFQTCATTFRNNFKQDFLDRIDYFTDEKKFTICEGDAFRNAIAFGFGKIYFENSVDALWRCDIGDWGTLSEFEQNLCNMIGYRELFEIYSEKFGVDLNAKFMLDLSANFYRQSVINFGNALLSLEFFKFKCKPYFNKTSIKNYGNTDSEKIINAILAHGNFFNERI